MDDVKHVGVVVLSIIGSFGGLLVLMGLAVTGTVRAKPGFPWCCTFRRGLVTVQVNKGGVLHHRHDVRTAAATTTTTTTTTTAAAAAITTARAVAVPRVVRRWHSRVSRGNRTCAVCCPHAVGRRS